MKVAVLMGGRSPERDISLLSGRNVVQALQEAGFETEAIDAGLEVAEQIKASRAEAVFIALHGEYGEDGTLQGMLEYLNIPYTGPGVLASSLAMNKVKSKKMFEAYGIPTPPWLYFNKEEMPLEEMAQKIKSRVFGYPVIVKPSTLGSAIGVYKVKNETELESALEGVLNYSPQALAEKFIAGRELTVGILGGKEPFALPVTEILPKEDFYNYTAKYQKGMSDHVVPALIPAPIYEKAQELGLRAHQALDCYGMSRVDLMLEGDSLYVLEVNTIPGMTDTSLLPEAAKKAGIDFPELVRKQVEWAISRQRENLAYSRRTPEPLKN